MKNATTSLASLMMTVAAMCFLSLGCGRAAVSPEWEIAVENRGDVAVDVVVTHGIKTANGQSHGSANVGNLGKGRTHSLLVGPDSTVVETVKVTRGGATQEMKPAAELAIGQKFLIVVESDGKVSGSVVRR